MAFSFETLTKEEGNKLQKEYDFRDISSEKSIFPEWRVVDNDRDAFLVALRLGEPQEIKKTIAASRQVVRFSYFELVWHGKRIQIQCSEALNLDKSQVNYTINQATADPALEPKRDELIKLIEEAFVARKVEYKNQEFAFRDFYGKLGSTFQNVYFDGEKMIDVTIKSKFVFKSKPADLSEPNGTGSRKILIDEVYGATLERLGFEGGAEHFLLTLDGHPIYLRRTYEVWMIDSRQVLWSYDQMLASHELYSDKREKTTIQSKIAYDALLAWGFGDVKYLRGPSKVVKNPGIQYAPKGVDVIKEGLRDFIKPFEPVNAQHNSPSITTTRDNEPSPKFRLDTRMIIAIIVFIVSIFTLLSVALRGL